LDGLFNAELLHQVKGPIGIMSITRSCESLSAEVSLLGTTKVDLTVGLVGLQSDWDKTMAIYQDVTQATTQQGGLLDRVTNGTGPARSIASGLISLVVKGNPGIFSRASASNFYIEVKQLATMHFLDATRFNTVLGLFRSNSAYLVSTDLTTGRPHIEFTQLGGLFGCALYCI
jgi:hypothetical protein